MKYVRHLKIAGFVALWLAATGGLSYVAMTERATIVDGAARVQARITAWDGPDKIGAAYRGAMQDIAWTVDSAQGKAATAWRAVADGATGAVSGVVDGAAGGIDRALAGARDIAVARVDAAKNFVGGIFAYRAPLLASADAVVAPPAVQRVTLSEIMALREEAEAARAARIEPASGTPEPSWKPEQTTLDVEAVLVPRQVTVISSSQDGRIAVIPVDHGDHFKKGDVLVAYDCAHLQAEADIVKIEKKYTEKRVKGSDALFKLEIISDLDRIGAQVEDQKAIAKGALVESRLKDCEIRAEFDGRVTNRLANPGEYTRTDRVLLEVASEEALQAEFLMPSKWLRWVNIGAPVEITVGETERSYGAKIVRIYGEVDPVSQSIQMIATLDQYRDPLLPGMSGKATIDLNAIREAGVRGYLEARAGDGEADAE
jgi:RND family efflux transporter MFP subunit